MDSDNDTYYLDNSTFMWDDEDYRIPVFYMERPEEMLNPSAVNQHFVSIIIIHAITFLVGLLGNIVAVTVMLGDRKSRSATNLFLVSLAVADLLLLLVYAPLETLQYFVIQWDKAGAVCKTAKYAELISAVASVLNLTAVTMERFIVIVFPMRSRSVCTLSNCRKAILVVWVMSLLLAVPVLFTKDTAPVTFTNNETSVTIYYCNDRQYGVDQQQFGEDAVSPYRYAFAVYQFIILFAAPGIVMVICYSFVIRELWRSTRNIKYLTNTKSGNKASQKSMNSSLSGNRSPIPDGSWDNNKSLDGSRCLRNGRLAPGTGVINASSSENLHRSDSRYSVMSTGAVSRVKTGPKISKGDDAKRARKQVIKMLILVIILFLVCWGPRLIMEILIKVGLHDFSVAVYTTRVALYLLPFVHSCVNPIIYSFMSKNFRRSMFRQLEYYCGCCLRRLPASCMAIRRGDRPMTMRKMTRNNLGADSVYFSTYGAATESTRQTEVESVTII